MYIGGADNNNNIHKHYGAPPACAAPHARAVRRRAGLFGLWRGVLPRRGPVPVGAEDEPDVGHELESLDGPDA